MAWVEAPRRTAFAHGRRLYVRAPRPIDFPSEEPLEEHVSETKRHLEARTTLYLLLKDALASASIGSDQFVYWDAADPRKCLSPDVFVKLGAREETFDNWKIWERGAPDLAVEIVSASDRSDAEWAVKLERYQASGIREVVRFDPANAEQPIQAWDRIEGELLERSPESTELRECTALELWWVVLPSAYGPMLRLARDRQGNLLPTPGEDRRRLAEELAEEQKARTVAEHDRLLERHARMLVEGKLALEQQARALAEEERKLAERKQALAEEKLREALAEIERLRADAAQGDGPR